MVMALVAFFVYLGVLLPAKGRLDDIDGISAALVRAFEFAGVALLVSLTWSSPVCREMCSGSFCRARFCICQPFYQWCVRRAPCTSRRGLTYLRLDSSCEHQRMSTPTCSLVLALDSPSASHNIMAITPHRHYIIHPDDHILLIVSRCLGRPLLSPVHTCRS